MQRKEFMMELAMDLVKPWSVLRLANQTLSRTLKEQICTVFGLNPLEQHISAQCIRPM